MASSSRTYRSAISIAHSLVGSGGVTNYPLCLTEAAFGASHNIWTNAQNGGGDPWFFSDANCLNRLACEINLFNTSTKKCEIYVNVPNVTGSDGSTDTTIYCRYKGDGSESQPAANAAYGSQAVWDANYLGVWHLGDGTTVSTTDSSATGSTLTLHNGPSAQAGVINGGMGCGTGPARWADVANRAISNIVTLEVWAYTTGTQATHVPSAQLSGMSGSPSGFSLITDASGVMRFGCLNRSYATDSIASPTNAWVYWGGTWNSSAGGDNKPRLYRNGSIAATGATGTLASAATQFGIGNSGGNTSSWNGSNTWVGGLDECRLSNVVRSDAYFTTVYNNLSSPGTFASAAAGVVWSPNQGRRGMITVLGNLGV